MKIYLIIFFLLLGAIVGFDLQTYAQEQEAPAIHEEGGEREPLGGHTVVTVPLEKQPIVIVQPEKDTHSSGAISGEKEQGNVPIIPIEADAKTSPAQEALESEERELFGDVTDEGADIIDPKTFAEQPMSALSRVINAIGRMAIVRPIQAGRIIVNLLEKSADAIRDAVAINSEGVGQKIATFAASLIGLLNANVVALLTPTGLTSIGDSISAIITTVANSVNTNPAMADVLSLLRMKVRGVIATKLSEAYTSIGANQDLNQEQTLKLYEGATEKWKNAEQKFSYMGNLDDIKDRLAALKNSYNLIAKNRRWELIP